MKYVFLLLLGCLACESLKAQHQEVFDEFRREAGDQAEMFSGKVEPGYPPTIYLNHPYWAFGEFSKGTVVFDGLLYKEVQLRYDAYLKQLVVNTPIKHSNVMIPMDRVEKFTLGETEYSRRNGEMVAVLYTSPRMELIEQMNVGIQEKMVDNARVQYEFKRNVKYLVLRGGQVHEVSNLRSVVKLFPGLKKELRSFARMYHLDFKALRQTSLVSMIQYADELLAKPLN